MKMRRFFVKTSITLLTFGITAIGVMADETTYPVTLTDDLGTEVTLNEAPDSIVSLSPVNTELLFALGAGDAVVGRTDYCSYPAEAADVDSIGTYTAPNMELILSKTPDLVLASDYIDDAIRAQLEENGIAVFVTKANDLSEIENDIKTVGELVGKKDKADEIVDGMEADLSELSEVLKGVEKEKTACIDLGSLYSAGPGSLLDNTLNLICVENIAGDADNMWPQISAEKIIEADPDVYISLFSKQEEVKAIAGLADLSCVNDHFIYIDGSSEEGDMIQRPGPRYVKGAETLAKLVYPELF